MAREGAREAGEARAHVMGVRQAKVVFKAIVGR